MEMPCLCDCGEWFYLNDGHRDLRYGSNRVVCDTCHINQKEREELQDKIYDLSTYGNKKREIKKLQNQLDVLGGKLNDY